MMDMKAGFYIITVICMVLQVITASPYEDQLCREQRGEGCYSSTLCPLPSDRCTNAYDQRRKIPCCCPCDEGWCTRSPDQMSCWPEDCEDIPKPVTSKSEESVTAAARPMTPATWEMSTTPSGDFSQNVTKPAISVKKTTTTKGTTSDAAARITNSSQEETPSNITTKSASEDETAPVGIYILIILVVVVGIPFTVFLVLLCAKPNFRRRVAALCYAFCALDPKTDSKKSDLDSTSNGGDAIPNGNDIDSSGHSEQDGTVQPLTGRQEDDMGTLGPEMNSQEDIKMGAISNGTSGLHEGSDMISSGDDEEEGSLQPLTGSGEEH